MKTTKPDDPEFLSVMGNFDYFVAFVKDDDDILTLIGQKERVTEIDLLGHLETIKQLPNYHEIEDAGLKHKFMNKDEVLRYFMLL